MEIEFRSERTASRSAMRPIRRCATGVRGGAESVASLITVIVAAIPWVIVIVPGIWALAKAWRRARQKRAAAGAA